MPSKSMSRVKSKAISRTAPWWLATGDEECPHCGQLYAYEAEFRCPDCDGAICMHCVVLHEERNVCPDCVSVPAKRGAKAGR